MIPSDDKKSGGGDRDSWLAREERASTPWALLLFGLVGTTAAATIAVRQFRRTVELYYSQLRSQPYSLWRNASYRKYNERMQELHEEEMERVERIRQMQSVFHRAARKHKKTYECWEDHGPSAYPHNQRDDWYWKTDASYTYQRTNFGNAPPKGTRSTQMSHHYTVLGLDRTRAKPYSDAEIKAAFRTKAMEYHPDQNPDNKEAAEAKFKDVLLSYEAIQFERKNG